MTESEPVSWRTIVYGTPVRSADGVTVGEVREVLGSDEEDIFHGLRVHLHKPSRDVVLDADDLSSLASDEITTVLGAADIESLPDFDEAPTFHVGTVGGLRKHLGWKRDDKSDEEPG